MRIDYRNNFRRRDCDNAGWNF